MKPTTAAIALAGLLSGKFIDHSYCGSRFTTIVALLTYSDIADGR